MVFALFRKRAAAVAVAICVAFSLVRFVSGQVIEFESKGLHYQALTKGGMTVMYAPIPSHIKDFSVIQVAITNGTGITWVVKNQDFKFIRQDGEELDPVSADTVVESLLAKASHSDVIQLQLLYENTIYALANFRSTNGYEKRRQEPACQLALEPFCDHRREGAVGRGHQRPRKSNTLGLIAV